MRVEAVQIRNFRSVDSCELGVCDGFNILIGKNNSGKSNILAAINAFFAAVSDGNVVCLDPLVRRGEDFYNLDTDRPAEITLTLSLQDDERALFTAGIVEDAPRMSNAVDNLSRDFHVRVRIGFNLNPRIYGSVSRISLVQPSDNRQTTSDSEIVILNIDQDAALELHKKYLQYRENERRIKELQDFLTSIDREDWLRMRRDPSEVLLQFRRLAGPSRRHSLDSRAQLLVESAIQEPATFEEFRGVLEGEIDTLTLYTPISDKHKLDQGSVETFAGSESVIPNHVLNFLHRLSEVKVLNITDDRRPIGPEEAQRLLNLKMQRGGLDHLLTIQRMVSTLLGVRIDAFASDQTPRSRQVSAELDVDNFLVEVNGSGIKEALRLLLDIEFHTPHLLLVEEPEIHLHPALESGMMGYLKEVSRKCQVFITTHSTNFLDHAEMKNIYLISKPESTSAELLSQSEAEDQIPVELGIRPSSLFIHDRLVFVESPTDEEIIREWASKLDVNLDQANVGFVHMGGARNFSYFAASSTLSFLAKRQVNLWFLIDRDEKDEKDISVIQCRLGSNAVASVLEKREIENYLIIPNVLANHIASKASRGGSQIELPSEGEIDGLIKEASDNLREAAIFKRVAKNLCQPLYPNLVQRSEDTDGRTAEEKVTEQIEEWEAKVAELKSAIAEETKRQSEMVTRDWDQRKLDMVPGDSLIDMVYKHYGVRFHKKRGDGVELARMMTKGDICREIEELIRAIGA